MFLYKEGGVSGLKVFYKIESTFLMIELFVVDFTDVENFIYSITGKGYLSCWSSTSVCQNCPAPCLCNLLN